MYFSEQKPLSILKKILGCRPVFYRLNLSVMEYFCPLKTLKYVKYCRFIVLSSFRKFLPVYLYVQYGKELKQDNQSIGKLTLL